MPINTRHSNHAKRRIKHQGRASGIFRSTLDRLQNTIETLHCETSVYFAINLLALGNKTALLADIIAGKRIKRLLGGCFLEQLTNSHARHFSSELALKLNQSRF